MLLDFFKSIETQLKKKLPLVAYRKPKEEKIKAIFQADDRLHPLRTYTETGFIFAPFDAADTTILLVPDKILEIPAHEPPTDSIGLDVGIRAIDPDIDMHGPTSDPKKKESHIDLIQKALTEIDKGNFKKVVLSRCFETDSNALPLDLFHRLLATYTNAFCYLWYHPKVGLWLGATPEILLMTRNRQLTTMSLAGTQKYTGSENPTWGPKEVEEQQLVTDYITNTLEGKVGQIRQTTTETVRAGGLLHLRTKITAALEQENLETVVKALHPTPAVCGMPKKNAQNFIRDNENYNREYYTGFLGELNLKTGKQRSSRRKNQENQAYRSIANTTTLFVNLRCMQLKDEKAYIYIGGGITKDSKPEQEWEETVAKSSTMLSILG